ncbi:MAG: hypothetical protein Q4D38_00205 [Planctomycetia bacterium]|nr:hypothetical protein [Planctomycetia bacterium]
MTVIRTTLGGREIEVEVAEGSISIPANKLGNIQFNPVSLTPICDIPEPPEHVIEVPEPPVWGTDTPSDVMEIPKSVIASMLPCDEEGLFPCPTIDIDKIEEATGNNSVNIHFEDEKGRLELGGRLVLDFAVTNKCCCDAENGEDKIIIQPMLEWKNPYVDYECPTVIVTESTPGTTISSQAEDKSCLYLRRNPPIELCGTVKLSAVEDDNTCTTYIQPEFDLTMDGEFSCPVIEVTEELPAESTITSSATSEVCLYLRSNPPVKLCGSVTLNTAEDNSEDCLTYIQPEFDLTIDGEIPCPEIQVTSEEILTETNILGSVLYTRLSLTTETSEEDCSVILTPVLDQYMDGCIQIATQNADPVSVDIAGITLTAQPTLQWVTDENCNGTLRQGMVLNASGQLNVSCPEINVSGDVTETVQLGNSTLTITSGIEVVTDEDCVTTLTPVLTAELNTPLDCGEGCDLITGSGAPIELLKYGSETLYVTPTIAVTEETNEDGSCVRTLTPELIMSPDTGLQVDCYTFDNKERLSESTATISASDNGVTLSGTLAIQVTEETTDTSDCINVKFQPVLDLALDVACPELEVVSSSEVVLTGVSPSGWKLQGSGSGEGGSTSLVTGITYTDTVFETEAIKIPTAATMDKVALNIENKDITPSGSIQYGTPVSLSVEMSSVTLEKNGDDTEVVTEVKIPATELPLAGGESQQLISGITYTQPTLSLPSSGTQYLTGGSVAFSSGNKTVTLSVPKIDNISFTFQITGLTTTTKDVVTSVSVDGCEIVEHRETISYLTGSPTVSATPEINWTTEDITFQLPDPVFTPIKGPTVKIPTGIAGGALSTTNASITIPTKATMAETTLTPATAKIKNFTGNLSGNPTVTPETITTVTGVTFDNQLLAVPVAATPGTITFTLPETATNVHTGVKTEGKCEPTKENVVIPDKLNIPADSFSFTNITNISSIHVKCK